MSLDRATRQISGVEIPQIVLGDPASSETMVNDTIQEHQQFVKETPSLYQQTEQNKDGSGISVGRLVLPPQRARLQDRKSANNGGCVLCSSQHL